MGKNLTTGSVFRTIVTFALPYLLSYFLQTLYGMADLFIAGQFIGIDGITAVANGSQVLYMLTVVIVGLAMGATVTIGNNVFIGPNCTISTAGHPFEARLRGEGLEYAKAVTIGSNVWIGMGVQICPGVTIGDNAVIGAGSVVTKDVPAGWLAYGNPCAPVKAVEEKPVRRIL